MCLGINSKYVFALLLISLSFAVSAAGRQNSALLGQSLADYEKSTGVFGNLSSVGSDTLANLMTLWAEEYKRFYPSVNIQIQAAGSSTAPPALTAGTSTLGPMSRRMKSGELAAFEDKYSYKPLAIPVAIDALTIYINKDNPLKGLSVAQVDAIFSSTRKCGSKVDITKWGNVGLNGAWALKSIQLYGRNSVSGTYGFFKKKALCKGDYKNNVNEQPGSASVVQSVTTSINGIGYSGIGYKTSGVKTVPLNKKAGQPYIPASRETAASGQYPFSRFLYIYVNKQPNKSLAPLEKEFLKMVLSRQGQQIVVKDGYIPLPVHIIQQALQSIK